MYMYSRYIKYIALCIGGGKLANRGLYICRLWEAEATHVGRGLFSDGWSITHLCIIPHLFSCK